MTAILDFLQSIVDFLDNFGERISSEVSGSLQMMDMIAEFRENIYGYIAWMPDAVVSVVFFGFSLCILYVFLGRT